MLWGTNWDIQRRVYLGRALKLPEFGWVTVGNVSMVKDHEPGTVYLWDAPNDSSLPRGRLVYQYRLIRRDRRGDAAPGKTAVYRADQAQLGATP